MSNAKNFYTYAYMREDGTPYYIGKGRGYRAWNCHARCAAQRPSDPSRIILLKKNLSEEDAFKHEKYMIAILGRKDLGTGILRNQSDGGEGSSGFSEEVIDRIRRARNKQASPWPVGSKHSDATKRRYRETRKIHEYTFWGPNGEIVTGVGVADFCELHPNIQPSNLRATARGDRNHCGGWRATRILIQGDSK